jgi:hypothetical protein
MDRRGELLLLLVMEVEARVEEEDMCSNSNNSKRPSGDNSMYRYLHCWTDWAVQDGTPMHDTTEPTSAPATAPSRARHSTSNAHADSVPERAVAFAHRAAQRRKEKLDNLLTRAIHQGSLPFNINDAVKHPAMAEFFKLVDYVPPNRHKIADDVYDHTHDQSDEIIAYTS